MSKYPSRKQYYNDDSDYTTNAPSYYDDLARKQKLFEKLSKKIWDYDKELEKRFEEWDQLIKQFPDDVLKLLEQWLLDGTFEHIINVVLLGSRARIVTSKEEPEHDDLTYWYHEISNPSIECDTNTECNTNIIVSKNEPDTKNVWYEIEGDD